MSKSIKRPIIESDSEDSDSDQGGHSLASMPKRPKPSVPAAQSSGSGSTSDSDSDAEWTIGGGTGGKKMALGVTKKGQSGGKSMVHRKVSAKKVPPPVSSDSSEDDEDEEDVDQRKMESSSSEGSSSDSDSSSEESLKFDDGLDEQLQGDEEDQKKLSLMNEKEREAEMYNRYEKREALKARFEIEQKLRRQKKHEKRKAKEEKMKRMVVRGKRGKQQDRSKSQAMDEYKAKRSADKIRKAEAEKHQEEKEPLKASDIFTSESDDEGSSSEASDSDQRDSDDEAGAKAIAGLRESAPKYISTAHELAKIRLSRYRLEKWVHMPFFSEAITGCYVRIGIGAHEGRMIYRICEIIAVQETPKVYTLGSTKTNKGLKLRHGIQERIFRMEYVSNSPPSDTEFHKWKVEMERKGLKLPTVDFVRHKARKLDEFKNISLKEEDVEKIIQEKQRFRKNPRNYAMTKSRLIREKEMAEQEGDIEKAGKLADKLLELEERADQLDKQRTKGLSAITYINERNRQRNVTRAEQALKEELAAMEGKEDDPFTRRKCQPKLVTLAVKDSSLPDVLQQLTQEKKAGDKKTDKKEKTSEARPATPNGQSSSKLLEGTPNASLLSATPAPPKSEQVDDLFSAHDFDIQIDLPSAGDDTSTPKTMPKSDRVPKQDGPRRSLNLADYKKRRGLI